MSLVIANALVCDPGREYLSDVRIEGGLIRQLGLNLTRGPNGDVIDAAGRALLPGFIDVHIQGAGGRDLLDTSDEALATISETCTRYGVTGFLGTTVFHPGTGNSHLVRTVGQSEMGPVGAHFLGLHLEGPFISPRKRGMIHPDAICEPSADVLGEVLERTGGKLRMMTIAPELPGSLEIIGRLSKLGIVPSFGHSAATYEQTLRGIEAGITHATHLFNAMDSIHHRAPGPLPAIFESKGVSAQIISDGVHIVPPVVRLAASLLGEDRCILITDGMRPLGLGDGNYVYDGRRYESKDGVARYEDGTLIGTSLGISQLAARFRRFTDWPLSAIAKATSWNPAKALGLNDRKGRISPGYDADIVITDRDFSVWKTIVAGRIAFESTG